jgi:hypothetical protein
MQSISQESILPFGSSVDPRDGIDHPPGEAPSDLVLERGQRGGNCALFAASTPHNEIEIELGCTEDAHADRDSIAGEATGKPSPSTRSC